MSLTITEYFQTTTAQRILLVDCQRADASSTCYRLASEAFATESTDTPASMIYSAAIAKPGLPEFRRTLNDPWDGGASTGFGTLSLTTAVGAYTTSTSQGEGTMVLPRGTPVTMRVAAPRSLYPLADAIVLAVGKVQRLGGGSRGATTLEVVDGSQDLAQLPLTVAPADGPWVFGHVRNIRPALKDPATLKYAVNGGRRVHDFTAVYDDGVALSSGAYTKNVADGTFTLALDPVGTVTCDVQGDAPSSSWLSTTTQVVNRVLDLAGVSGVTRSITLPSGTIGYAIESSTTLGNVLGELTHHCMGYWLIDRDGDLIVAQYPVPASGGTVLDESSLLGEVTWTETDRLYNPVHYAWRKNWTQYQAKPDATAAMAAFAAGSGEASSVSATPAAEYVYTASPTFQTFFDDSADALTLANRLLSMSGVPRKELSFAIPYSEAMTIGTLVSVRFGGQTLNAAVVAVTDVWDGAYPKQKLKAIA